MVLRLFEAWFAGRTAYQPLFHRLNSMALLGMNYGRGHDVRHSGEGPILQELRREGWLPPQARVLDIGANKGQYASQFLDAMGPGVELHLFEPSPGLAPLLQALHPRCPKLQVHSIGLGDRNETLMLYNSAEGSSQASFVPRSTETFDVELRPFQSLPVRRLDELAQEQGWDLIHWMKLDVEGFELKVLQGAADLLDGRRIRAFQFETGPAMIDARTYFKDFFDLLSPHYHIYRLLQHGKVLLPAYDERLEVFLVTNHLALSKYGPA